MSYCRFGPDSDLYVVGVGDGYQCINCKLMPDEYASWSGKTRTDVFKHFMDHEDCGDKVPLSALRRITEELANIPQEHWENEFETLMHRLAAPNIAFNEIIDRTKMCMIVEDLFAAIADLDKLNWPPDEYDD